MYSMDKLFREQWIDQFLDWASSQSNVRAILLVGSQSRSNQPADEWSDFDFIIIASNPQIYLESTDWLFPFGNFLFSIIERTSTGETIERRVLFEDGLDVDFIVLSPVRVSQNFAGTFVIEIIQRGMRVLLDKDGLFSSWTGEDESRSRKTIKAPTVQEFSEVVQDFWFHAVWMAKKLRRGELWVATTCNNVYMKQLLLRMVEWHTQVTRSGQVDIWFNGRFIEQWAPEPVLRELKKVCSHYEEEEVWKALRATMDLFHRVAQETAERLQYTYPTRHAEKAVHWVTDCYSSKADL